MVAVTKQGKRIGAFLLSLVIILCVVLGNRTFTFAEDTSTVKLVVKVSNTSTPVADTTKPVANIEAKVANTSKPVADTDQPVADTNNLIADTDILIADLDNPIANIDAPVIDMNKPVADFSNPIADATKPAYIEISSGDTVYGNSYEEDTENYQKKDSCTENHEILKDGVVYLQKTQVTEDHEVLSDGFVYGQKTSEPKAHELIKDGYVYSQKTSSPGNHEALKEGFVYEQKTSKPGDHEVLKDGYVYGQKTSSPGTHEVLKEGYVYGQKTSKPGDHEVLKDGYVYGQKTSSPGTHEVLKDGYVYGQKNSSPEEHEVIKDNYVYEQKTETTSAHEVLVDGYVYEQKTSGTDEYEVSVDGYVYKQKTSNGDGEVLGTDGYVYVEQYEVSVNNNGEDYSPDSFDSAKRTVTFDGITFNEISFPTSIPSDIDEKLETEITIALLGNFQQSKTIYGNANQDEDNCLTISDFNAKHNYGIIEYSSESSLIVVETVKTDEGIVGRVKSNEWITQDTDVVVNVCLKGNKNEYVKQKIKVTLKAPTITSLDINNDLSGTNTQLMLGDKQYFAKTSDPTITYDFEGEGIPAIVTAFPEGIISLLDNDAVVDNTDNYSAKVQDGKLIVEYKNLQDGQYNIQWLSTESTHSFIVDTNAPTFSLTASDAYRLYSKDGKAYLYPVDENKAIKRGLFFSGDSYEIALNLTITDNSTEEATHFDGKAYLDALKIANINASLDTSDSSNGVFSYNLTFSQKVEETGKIRFKIPAITDYAGNTVFNTKPDSVPISIIPKGQETVNIEKLNVDDYSDTEHWVETSFYLDAQPPYNYTTVDNETGAPNALITFNGNSAGKYFLDNVTATINVTDGEDGSGIALVEYYLENANGIIKNVPSKTNPEEIAEKEGTYSVDLEHAGKDGNDVAFIVQITDQVGNVRSFKNSFNLDVNAPIISEPDLSAEKINTVDSIEYFNNELTYTFSVTDLNLAEINASYTYDYFDNYSPINGKTVQAMTSINEGKGTVTFTVKDGQKLTGYSITAYDEAGQILKDKHFIEKTENNLKQVVDETRPTIEFIQSDIKPEKTVNNVDYYANEVQIDVEVFDLNFDIKNETITFLLDGSELKKTLKKKGTSGKDQFTYITTIILDDKDNQDPSVSGDILENIQGTIKDLATNTPDNIKGTEKGVSDSLKVTKGKIEKDTSWHNIVIDKVAPGIKLSELPNSSKSQNSKGDTFYYQKKQTITIVVTDINLDCGNSSITYDTMVNGKTKSNVISLNDKSIEVSKKKDKEAIYSYTTTIEDGTLLSNLQIQAKDYALHESSDKSVQKNSYIVDGTAPSVDVQISGKGIDSFFTNGKDVYVKFKTVAKGESEKAASAGPEKVTLTISVADKNIEINQKAGFKNSYYVLNNLKNSISWKAANGINQNADTKISYSTTITVPTDQSNAIEFRLTIQDLAGNTANAFSSNLENAEKSKIKLNGDNGFLTGTIVADRERPSSVNDEKNTPVITLKANTNNVNTLDDNILLYAGDMSYALTVYDPMYKDSEGKNVYSGLSSVIWTVESDQSGLIYTSGNTNNCNGAQKSSFTIPVNINGSGESNKITLKITATDNAGNVTTKEQKLAIDNQKPRVTVSYNNNSVQNRKYFKADRLLTLTVEDLNFDTSRTSVTTQPGVSGWSKNGNVYTATVNYNSDGDYTFAMETTDKAGNKADIDYTNGGRNVAEREFTIDKTAPVINISFDNNNVRNGKYYNANRTATVNIVEHNFNASEVRSTVTASLDGNGIAAPSLGAFSGGDNHNAAIPFMQDGDYTIRVDYTDLAGNPAQTATVSEFTVDTTKPEATISDVTAGTAYTGVIMPKITFRDINFDPNGYSITWNVTKLDGTKAMSLKDAGSVANIAHGVEYTLNNLANIIGNDGIYNISATITDLAGNSYTTGNVMYSVNRFGSVYTANDDATKALIESGYIGTAPVLSFLETNPNKLKNFSVSLAVNGTTKTLVEGVDYEVKKMESDGSWKQYVYNIFDSAFLNENGEPIQGAYVITLYSEDEAGNKNSNRTNAEDNSLDVEFTIDSESPAGYMNVEGMSENSNRIQAAETNVNVHWEDNNGIAKVDIFLNGELVKTLEGEELAEFNGTYPLAVNESNEYQNVYAVLTDYAGNTTQLDPVTFYLNSSGFQQFVHNTPLFIGSIVVLVLIIAAIIFLVARKKKKKEE